MLSFRKKILISDSALFLLFLPVIFLSLKNDIKMGLFLWAVYTATTLFIVFRLSQPIQHIINAITPYQEGKIESLPQISLSGMPSMEYFKLAKTLNLLTEKISSQIETLKTQRQQTQAILESLGEGLIAVDPKGIITFANPMAAKMLSVQPEMLVGRTFFESPLQKKCQEMVLYTLHTSDSLEDTWEEKKETRTSYFDLFSSPLLGRKGVILVLQDKTAHHQLTQMGRDFIANASHELRTPLTILRGFAEMLQNANKLPSHVVGEIGEKIVKTSERLEKLVKSLLTLTNIENTREERFGPCDVIAIAENCRNLLQTLHPEVQISFEKESSATEILGDADLLDLALMNLLENAVKYSPQPAKIQMSSRFTLEGIQLTVKDLGIGIPERDLPYIFNRFYTVDKARSRKSGGAGLGLSIVKSIMEKHKGKITVTSWVSKGTQFTLTFPIEGKIQA